MMNPNMLAALLSRRGMMQGRGPFNPQAIQGGAAPDVGMQTGPQANPQGLMMLRNMLMQRMQRMAPPAGGMGGQMNNIMANRFGAL